MLATLAATPSAAPAAALQRLDRFVVRGETTRARAVGAERAAASPHVDRYLRSLPAGD